MIKRNLILILILVTCSLGASAAAQSTHVHGQGQVGMAIDQNLISMTLESPGADIVGFEHEARTAEEKTAVTEALKQLSDPMFVIQLPANASCKVVQASSEVTSENGDEGHADHEEHEEHADHDDHEDHEKHGDHDEHEGHADHEEHEEHADHEKHENEAHGSFIAEYQLECATIAAIDSIKFVYFDHFRNAQSLIVVLIDKNGQHRHEISRDNPILYLKK
ncbi:ZrgA family zinc uptake protein [Arenicellales bacterium IMCC58067]